ncbi:MAG: thioredoxin [Ilumatobacteraceae bacterium]|nr:thioredoxin [Ilumatobacteraceae bacterium]
MAEGIVTLTSSTFDEIVNSSTIPILVDFWAEWCAPCKAIAPVLADIALEQDGHLAIAKLNVDDHGDIAQRFGVMSIPTLLVFDQGQLQKTLVGALGKSRLLAELEEFLPSSR